MNIDELVVGTNNVSAKTETHKIMRATQHDQAIGSPRMVFHTGLMVVHKNFNHNNEK